MADGKIKLSENEPCRYMIICGFLLNFFYFLDNNTNTDRNIMIKISQFWKTGTVAE